MVAEQVKTWDPFLGWLQAELGIELAVTTGVLPLTQSETAMVRLTSEVEALDDFCPHSLSCLRFRVRVYCFGACRYS